ncbi:two-component system, chemotaxis family, sensor kinase CheA [Acetitomaculum ruminis DSM 5522]|uniref:Chemotaxis protein CheA n=1 Tax=Acetitomaculum ruminis DSM 5522 TaxID=1120918 RepID=A0A1I0ZLB8_9FIRM|nr:chemotaxis protein CheA [Acetitomaculum ruminis]SFB25320.1 two-component system, chemotaxis family, sensor kinase CheA [Acetitomaculum ruminis DSM 5522]
MDVSQYLDVFIDETNEHLQNLNEHILVLEKEPENEDTVNEIFRAAHSLKGMAGTMGFKRMQRLTHDMENVFSEIRNGKMKVTSDLIDVVFQCLDAIQSYLDEIRETSNEGTEDNEPIIKRLNELIEIEKNGGSAPAPASEGEAASKEDEASAKDKKYMQIPLTDEDKRKMLEAKEGGMNIFGFTVKINETCILKAARAFLVFKAVEDFGTILASNPTSQDIEDEKLDFEFSMIVISAEPMEKIVESAKGISEIEDVSGESLSPESFDKKEEAAPAPAEEAAPAAPAPAPAAPAPAPAKKAAAPAAAKKPAASKTSKPVANRTVRVDIEKLDDLMNQVSELIIAKNSLVAISQSDDNSAQAQGVREQIEYLERITTNLHESVMKVRMVPIESVVNRFPRMIRDLSKKLDKKMELTMSGEDTELDRTVIDEIGDPLMHLLRNSADHGLESKEARKASGKPETGSIYLNAFQEGNNVIIEVGDDGNGIDVEGVKTKAIERGVITEEQAATMESKDIVDLLFLPSFSMAKKITDISGRGVGLDVVKSKIEALSGEVEVKTELGRGSKFIIRLPLTLAIIQALMVEIGTEKYAISLGSIQTIEDISVDDIKYVQAKEVIHIRGTVIPIIRMHDILDIESTNEDPTNLTVVIVNKGEKQAGLIIDNLIGQQEIVIKSLGKYIENNNKVISGATILGDGEVALILDVNPLI